MTTLPSSVTVNGQTVSIQWHHVINNASFEGSSFLQAIGWQQDSVARNLIPLASTTEGADLIGGARHSGGHPAYNSFIDFVVSAFDTAYRESNFGGLTQTQWLEQSAKKIDGFVSYLKVELKNPDSILKRHKDDLSAIDLDSKLWKGMESLFDPNTLEFHSPITSHSVYQGGLDNPGQYDATPGNGTALDITQGRTASQNAAAMASEFGLDSRPSNTGLLAHLAGLGHAFKGVLVVGGTALGVIGLYSDAAEAFEQPISCLPRVIPSGQTLRFMDSPPSNCCRLPD